MHKFVPGPNYNISQSPTKEAKTEKKKPHASKNTYLDEIARNQKYRFVPGVGAYTVD
jgi:hypothetical protein